MIQIKQSSADQHPMMQSQFTIGKPNDNELHKHINLYQWEDANTLLETDPSLATQRSELGEFPLHMSLKRGAPEPFLLKLIEVFDEAVQMTGLNDRSLPLHLATIHSLTPKVIIALIRMYPEALDQTDEDGDTPRNCVRLNLDPFAKEAIMKPTYYWSDLLQNFRREAEERVGKKMGAKIADLESKLEEEKKKSELRILELERKLLEKERELK